MRTVTIELTDDEEAALLDVVSRVNADIETRNRERTERGLLAADGKITAGTITGVPQ